MANIEIDSKDMKGAATTAVKSKRKGPDKWKSKKWYKVIASKHFNNIELAQTPGIDEEAVMGRVVAVNARDLTGNIKKNQLMVRFQVNDVQGLNANTKLHSLQIQPSATKRLVRRRSSKVESIDNVVCKDGTRVRIKSIAMCAYKVTRAQEAGIRAAIKQEVARIAKDFAYEDLIHDLVISERGNELMAVAKKIVPLKRVDVVKAIKLRS